MLLVQRRFVAKERIREILYPDQATDAFEKMFERDKEELRSLGVPIEVGQLDAFFDDEPGYRIRPDEFALPEIVARGRRGRRAGPGRQGVGARPAGRGHHRRRPQAHRRGCARRRVRTRPRPAAPRWPTSRRSTSSGRPRSSAPPVRLRLPPGRPARSRPATSSRGASSATPDAGTSSASTSTAVTSASSGSPGSRGGPSRRARRRPTTSRPAPTSARSPGGWPRPPLTEPAHVLVRQGAGHGLRRKADAGRGRRDRPRRTDRAGTAWCSAPWRPRRRGAVLRPAMSTSRVPPWLREPVVERLPGPVEAAG